MSTNKTNTGHVSGARLHLGPEVSIKYRDRFRLVDIVTAVSLFALISFLLLVGLCGIAGQMTAQGQHDASFCSIAWLRYAWDAASTDKALLFMALVSSLASALPLTLAAFPLVLNMVPSGRIKLRRDSITFPWYFSLALGGQLRRSWSDLASVTVAVRGTSSSDYRPVKLIFRSGGEALLDLSAVSPHESDLIISFADECAGDCQIDEQLIAATGRLQMERSDKFKLSYTKLWEDSLRSSMRSTVFVPLASGDVLPNGRLRIVRQLNSTPWTATYLARFNEKALVIVKESVIPDQAGSGAKAVELFDRECHILTRLKHPSIASVLDFFRENGRRYLVLEHFPGFDLRQVVRARGPLPEPEVLSIAREICVALEYLHDRDQPVIHRDISPDNLILHEDGNIRLIDFGAAKYFFANATGTMIGKQAFIAPEQLRGMPTVQSDIYALGATMYALVTGVEPVPLSQCLLEPETVGCSAGFSRLVASMTAFETSQRPVSANAVRLEIDQLSARTKFSTYPSSGASESSPLAPGVMR